jgi:hypothetical protein
MIKVFPMSFQSSMGARKARCDVLSGPPKDTFAFYLVIHLCKIQLEHNQWLVSVSFVKRTLSKMNMNGKNLDWFLSITSMKIGYNFIWIFFANIL